MMDKKTSTVNKGATESEFTAFTNFLGSDKVKTFFYNQDTKNLMEFNVSKFKSEFSNSTNLKYFVRTSEVNKKGGVAVESFEYKHDSLMAKISSITGKEGVLMGAEPQEVIDSIKILEQGDAHLYSVQFVDFNEKMYGVMHYTDSKGVYDNFSKIGLAIHYLDSNETELVSQIKGLGLDSSDEYITTMA